MYIYIYGPAGTVLLNGLLKQQLNPASRFDTIYIYIFNYLIIYICVYIYIYGPAGTVLLNGLLKQQLNPASRFDTIYIYSII